MKKRMLILGLVLTTTLSLAFQNPESPKVKYNDDGSVDFTYNGVRYLGLNRAQVDDYQRIQNDYPTCKADLADLKLKAITLTNDNELKEKDKAHLAEKVASLEVDLSRERDNGKRNYSLLVREQTLRTEEQQFIPHGKVGGVGGKLLNFLDGAYGQSLFKLVIPAAQFGKTYFGRCQSTRKTKPRSAESPSLLRLN